MNLTSHEADSNPFSRLKTRYVVALGGVALAIGIVVGSAGALKLNSITSSPAGAAPQAANVQTVQPMFGTAADADQATRGLIPKIETVPSAGSPMFASAADAEFAAQSLNPVAALPHPQAVQQQFGTAADAEYAAQSLR